ncbi:TPA: thymidine kinase [Bacillus cereus]|nr:thymidine kinase [Bacillus cereus]
MTKVYFRYGCMESAKTTRLLTDSHEYKQRGEFPLLLKPVVDTRSSKGMIESRTGLSAPCIDIDERFNIQRYVYNLLDSGCEVACIFVDEAQFLTTAHIVQLRMVADLFQIPVICYGLKTNFMGVMFDGSRALFEHANRFEEIKTICREEGCKSKAIYNVRFLDGEPMFEGESIVIGDTKQEKNKYYYIPKCSKHFFNDYNTFNKAKGE